jgi:putative DNA primase/helicase
MIGGCLAWQREGLSPPDAVRSATSAYLEAEDAIGAWIDDCCVRDPSARETSVRLFASWKVWAEQAGEQALSQKRFIQKLEDRGFHRTCARTARCR